MNRFFQFWRDESAQMWEPALPDGVRVYAVGDVHGHDALLADLLAQIEADRRQSSATRTVLVFLGDLIDRGPGSAAVLTRLRTLDLPGVSTVFLMGNHEEVLLRILDGDDTVVFDWLRFGGDKCMESYGVPADKLLRLPVGEAGRLIRRAIPAEDAAFIAGFSDTFRVGDFLFVHAGIRPGVPIAEQSASDLRWIRSPFLEWRDRHECCVVHGHTISPEVEQSPARIGIDTGAYCFGVLTAVGLEGTARWFIQAKA